MTTQWIYKENMFTIPLIMQQRQNILNNLDKVSIIATPFVIYFNNNASETVSLKEL